MKRYVLFLMVILLCIVTGSVLADSNFNIDTKGVLIDYTGNDAKVVIPGTVRTIGKDAFAYVTTAEEITIPSSVTAIEDGAFRYCTGLKSIKIPSTVETIGDMAFFYCTNLQQVSLPVKLKTISQRMFGGCSKLEIINIPSTVTVIEPSAFENCTRLESVTLPTNLTAIEDYVFSGCSRLESVLIPSKVKYIGDYAFSGCTSLTSIDIPSSVALIGGYAFSGCTGLSDLVMAGGLKSIERYAFSDCTGLTKITFPNNVTSIGPYAFSGCTGLLEMSLPNALLTLGEGAFNNCIRLSVVKLPSRLKTLGAYAFNGCERLSSIYFPNTLTSIGTAAIPNSNYEKSPQWYSDKEKIWLSRDSVLKRTKKADTYYGYDPAVQTKEITVTDPDGTDITGKTVTLPESALETEYKLSASANPSKALKKFIWISSDPQTAFVDQEGAVTFSRLGAVTITVRAADNSRVTAQVTLVLAAEPVEIKISDSNVRGKNKEIQIVVPWSDAITDYTVSLYDDSTNLRVNMAYKARLDSTGKNMIFSYVGAPLVNGRVYRVKVSVFDGRWVSIEAKYAMPIANVSGATVITGNRSMTINTKHRDPATGTRYMIYDASTSEEIASRVGTKSSTTWTYSNLKNGKLYYVVAVPYRDYKGQRLYGPNENRIYFIPLSLPVNAKVRFNNSTTATVSMDKDSTATGIRVLYRTVGGVMKNGCEGTGESCTISGLKNTNAYEFYVMKYRVANGKKYYSTGTLVPYRTTASGLPAPVAPTVTMSNSGYTVFRIQKAAAAEGISALYRVGEGAFTFACEKKGSECSANLDVSNSYTFLIMQYRTVNGKKVYSPGVVARDFTSSKSPDVERLYSSFVNAYGSVRLAEIAEAYESFLNEDLLLMTEAYRAMGIIPADEDAIASKSAGPEGIETDTEEGWLEFYRFEDSTIAPPAPSFPNK